MKNVAKRRARPGVSVRRPQTRRPMMELLDLLGRRWALRVIWELREGRRLNFRDLMAASGTSPSVLNTRLTDLRAAGIVDLADDGYALSASGADLLERLLPLHAWAEDWAARDAQRSEHQKPEAGLGRRGKSRS